ncbi:MAG: lyase family protein, partial [Actinomycetota bacterium]
MTSANSEGRTLWHGRFEGGPASELLAYTVSLPFDRTLWREDMTCSRAHVEGLVHQGIITADEGRAILQALDVVSAEMESGTFAYVDSDEDVHTAVERRVTEVAGSAGAKLHTGRSRNDQSVTGLRLWCKRVIPDVMGRIIELQTTLLERASEVGDAYLPGYTHVQRAQPVLLAHHLLAHGWAFERDLGRLHDAFVRLDVSPLGAWALVGSPLPLSPAPTSLRPGFSRVFPHPPTT